MRGETATYKRRLVCNVLHCPLLHLQKSEEYFRNRKELCKVEARTIIHSSHVVQLFSSWVLIDVGKFVPTDL